MQAIVFDMDGLMIDSERVYWQVGREIAREHGKQVSDQTLGNMMGRAPLESIRIYIRDLGLDADPERLLEEREARVQAIFEKGIEPMPGLMEVLNEFKPLYRLAIATSAKRYLVDVVLSGLNVLGYFQVVQTSDDITRGKPDPEIYLKALSRLNVPPAQAAVLEDSSNGALAGKRAGATVVAVPSIYTRDQDFSFVDYRAANLLDAARWIRERAAERQI